MALNNTLGRLESFDLRLHTAQDRPWLTCAPWHAEAYNPGEKPEAIMRRK
jgi:hypothetical protein